MLSRVENPAREAQMLQARGLRKGSPPLIPFPWGQGEVAQNPSPPLSPLVTEKVLSDTQATWAREKEARFRAAATCPARWLLSQLTLDFVFLASLSLERGAGGAFPACLPNPPKLRQRWSRRPRPGSSVLPRDMGVGLRLRTRPHTALLLARCVLFS